MFCTIISKIWSQINPAIILIEGFEKGELHRFNNEVFPAENYDPEAYKRWCVSNRKNNNLEEVAQPTLRQTLEERLNSPSTSTAAPVTLAVIPQISSANSINLEMPSTSSEQPNSPYFFYKS